jgi:hypothetical protein
VGSWQQIYTILMTELPANGNAYSELKVLEVVLGGTWCAC